MIYKTEEKFLKYGYTILSIISVYLTFRFAYSIGKDDPVIWGIVGVCFELIKVGAVIITFKQINKDFNIFIISSVVTIILCVFSGSASYYVVSENLNKSTFELNNNNIVKEQIIDLKESIKKANDRYLFKMDHSRSHDAENILNNEIKPQQQKLYLLESKINNKNNFLGENANNISIGFSSSIEILALFCSYILSLKNKIPLECNSKNDFVTECNSKNEFVTECKAGKDYIIDLDKDLYSEIKQDILYENIKPTFRNLYKYGLSQQEARLYLTALKNENILITSGEKAIRYKLNYNVFND